MHLLKDDSENIAIEREKREENLWLCVRKSETHSIKGKIVVVVFYENCHRTI